MKELSIEQKAKAYDEAIERAKVFKEHLLEINDKGYADEIDYIFPELAESEDEKTRKALKEYFINSFQNNGVAAICGVHIKGILAWLEKQASAHPADNVKPKFKVGDWIISHYNNVAYIESISETKYNLRCKDGYHEKLDIDCINRNWRLWTIKDAKDGDVLVAKGEYFKEYIFIYSKMTDDDVISTHCGYDVIRNASNKTMSRFGRVEDFHSVCPATKEQRDQLEKAMADAGFTFDFDKKELKKIEQKPVVIPKFKVGDKVKKGYLTYTVEDINEDSYKLQAYSKDGDKGCTVFLTIGYEKDYELVEQKPAWSEEDERKFSDILALLRGGENCHYNTPVLFDFLKSLKDRVKPQPKQEWSEEDEYNSAFIQEALLGLDGDDSYREKCCKMAKWLKSLKDRIQPKQEWSEEDEKIGKELIDFCIKCSQGSTVVNSQNDFIRWTTWLKSLRPQNTWKPSDEQMDALDSTLQYSQVSHNSFEQLNSLFNDLKKLREE